MNICVGVFFNVPFFNVLFVLCFFFIFKNLLEF